MRYVAMALLGVALALATDPKPDLETQLKEARQSTRLAELKALVYREQLAVQQLESIRSEQQALYAETCKAAGIETASCEINLDKHTVARKKEAK